MDNIPLLEACYKKYINNLGEWLPEGIMHVDLQLLHKMDLLNFYDDERHDDSLTRLFHVIEGEDKITLINDDFIVWIVPEVINELPVTYTLVAINNPSVPSLELAFSTTGVYNTSHLVLRILEKLLKEIQENEAALSSLDKK